MVLFIVQFILFSVVCLGISFATLVAVGKKPRDTKLFGGIARFLENLSL